MYLSHIPGHDSFGDELENIGEPLNLPVFQEDGDQRVPGIFAGGGVYMAAFWHSVIFGKVRKTPEGYSGAFASTKILRFQPFIEFFAERGDGCLFDLHFNATTFNIFCLMPDIARADDIQII